jgi:hypothetical protein
MGRVPGPEMPRPVSGTSAKTAKTAKTHPSAAFWPRRSVAGQAGAGKRRCRGQAIVGTVTHTSPDRGSPENQDQPYGTEHERARQPAADAPLWREATERLALPEVQS